MSDKVNLEFTVDEYIYLNSFLNENYKAFSKLPKKLLTDKFLILENLCKNQFSTKNLKGKYALK